MARNTYYKAAGILFNVMLGVNVTHEFNQAIERGANAAHRTKSDFLRIILEKGLKAVQDEKSQSFRPS